MPPEASSEREQKATAAADMAGTDVTRAGSEKVSAGLAASPARPVNHAATLAQVKALAHYMAKTEVHTYAFSVAAQVILSLFPFIVLLLTVSQKVFHSNAMTDMVGEMMTNFLPSSHENQVFVIRNMRVLAFSHAKTRLFSVFMLFITTTGVFLPLEVALNSVWGVHKNRSYLGNQIVSLGLAVGVGLLAMTSVILTTAQRKVLGWIFFGHTDNIVFNFVGHAFLQILALIASIGLFFLIYWGLPNRKVPPKSVLPTAVVIGILWTIGKYIYLWALPHLDFHSVYGPFEVSVGLMMWAFISGLLLLGGAYVSATRQALREAEARHPANP